MEKQEDIKILILEKIDFIKNLTLDTVWYNNPELIKKYFEYGEFLIDNQDLLENINAEIVYNFWDFISEPFENLFYTDETYKSSAFLEKTFEYSDAYPNFSKRIFFELQIIYEIGTGVEVLGSENNFNLLLKNIRNKYVWPMLNKMIFELFIGPVFVHKVEIIKKIEQSSGSITDNGIFMDIVLSMIKNSLFKFEQLNNIRNIFGEILKSEKTSYFLNIKSQKIISEIGRIIDRYDQEGYEKCVEGVYDGFYKKEKTFSFEEEKDEYGGNEPAPESDDKEIGLSSNGFDYDKEYDLIMMQMPAYIPKSLKEKNWEEDWKYLIETCEEEIIKDFGSIFLELDDQQKRPFLEFVKKKIERNIPKIKEFCNKYKNKGFKTFLSLEQDPELGDKIISFGESVNPEIAKKVFEKYSEIVDQAYKIEDFIASELSSEIKDQKQSNEIIQQIMVRAKDVLVQFINASELAKKKGIELSAEDISLELEKIKIDTILLSTTLRVMKQSGQKIDLEDIKNFSLEGHVLPKEVKDTDVSEMVRIYQENYKDFPNLQKILLGKHEEVMRLDSVEFTILRYKDNITGFYRLDNLPENEVHFAAFNVDAEFRGAGLGEAMMLEDLDRLAKEKIIKAECDQFARISSNYIERGFVANAHQDIAEKGVLSILRDDTSFNFESKKLSQEEIIEKYLKAKLEKAESGEELSVEVQDGNLTILSAEKQTDFDFKRMLQDGKILTRYFKFGDKEKARWYVVLETPSEKLN